MQSTHAARRIALAIASTIAFVAPAVTATSAQADILPLNIQKTVNVGTAHVYALGQIINVPVNATATVGLQLSAINSLLDLTLPTACPNGETGTLLQVIALGGPVTGGVTIATNLGVTTYVPINVTSINTGLVGFCLSGTGVS